jgi:hypothetical protein
LRYCAGQGFRSVLPHENAGPEFAEERNFDAVELDALLTRLREQKSWT